MTKYAANAMLATRISFMNQIARLCEAVGADVTHVRRGIGSDRRIGQAFLFPGPGYGGSCFPKDVKALIRTGTESKMSLDILSAVEEANQRQKRVLFEKLERHLGRLSGKVIAVWGLAFKAETDDVRESPALVLIEELLRAGAKVRAHDPAAMETARQQLGSRVTYAGNGFDALAGADALAIATEWLEYRNPDFAKVKQLLKRPLIVDARNLYDPQRLGRRRARRSRRRGAEAVKDSGRRTTVRRSATSESTPANSPGNPWMFSRKGARGGTAPAAACTQPACCRLARKPPTNGPRLKPSPNAAPTTPIPFARFSGVVTSAT